MDDFTREYREMPTNTKALVKQYLTSMISTDSTTCRTATATFSYPPRGGKNDGNPALVAIMQLIPKSRLNIEENEYTHQRAIWLCEDFTVSWPKKASQSILTQALQAVCSLD